MAGRIRKSITIAYELSTIVSALILISGIVTTTSFLVSLPAPPKLPLLNFDLLSDYLQQQEFFIRGFLFFISELANALFFGFIFNRLHKIYSGKSTHAFLFGSVIASTAFVSILFIKTIIFKGEMSASKIVLFFFLYLISFLITVVIFFIENSGNYTRGEDFIEQILGKVGSVTSQMSFLFLLVMYVIFFIMVLTEYFWHWS